MLVMLVLNYSHPLTDEQREQFRALTKPDEVGYRDFRIQIDMNQPLAPQITAVVDEAGLTPEEWSGLPIYVNLPGLNWAAAVLLAELHGRMGHFPPCLRLRPVKDSVPPRYEVAEILNLSVIRHEARGRRF